MRIFVTGGNGFIGSFVTRRLIERGYRVRCLLRSTSKTERIDDLPVERVTGDVREPASLREGIEGCEAVIHLASLSSWNDIASPLLDEVVAGGTSHVLEAAEAAGRPRTVFVSSAVAVNSTPTPVVHHEDSPLTFRLERYPYARAKVEAETRCRAATGRGLPVVIVNPGEVYGPNDHALVTAGNLLDFARNWPVLVCSGGTSIVHVEDVANGILAALERGRPGERYILAGENLTIRRLAEVTLGLLGREKPILLLPNALVRGVAATGSVLHLPLPFNPAVIPYATRYWFMDNTKARTELSVSFRSAAETLTSALRWLCESGLIGGAK